MMKKTELLSFARQLSPHEQLTLIQILVEELKQALPSPSPNTTNHVISLAPGQSMGRMATEATMQLSVNDLIYADDESIDIPGLTTSQDADEAAAPAAAKDEKSPPKDTAAKEKAPVSEGATKEAKVDETNDVSADFADVASELAAVLDQASTGAADAPLVPKVAAPEESVVAVEPKAAEEEAHDEDRVFESLLMELTGDELRVMETLSAVRRHFWAPLQEAFQALHVGSLRLAVETLEVAPMRIAIGEVVNASIIALVQNYHDFLRQHLDAHELAAAEHKELFVTKKNQDQLVLSLRAPFREYVERLERLDNARDELLEALEGEGATLAEAPLLDEAHKERLASRSGATGVAKAWMALHDAILAASPDGVTNEAANEAAPLTTFAATLREFVGQLEDLYDAVLYRVLELWNAHLLAPARNELPDL